MKEKNNNKKNNISSLIWKTIRWVIGLAILMLVIFIVSYKRKWLSKAQIEFLGGYLAAIIGGVATLFAVYFSTKNGRVTRG